MLCSRRFDYCEGSSKRRISQTSVKCAKCLGFRASEPVIPPTTCEDSWPPFLAWAVGRLGEATPEDLWPFLGIVEDCTNVVKLDVLEDSSSILFDILVVIIEGCDNLRSSFNSCAIN